MTGHDFWSPRRVATAVGGAMLTALVIGLPTVVIPNPVFGRAVPVTWWSYPVLATASLLSGLLLATYVADERAAGPGLRSGLKSVEDRSGSRRGAAAAALSFFAVGCPVCNKLVLLALGSSGALTWFAPAQPVLALVSVAGLAWALTVRMDNRRSCRTGTAAGPGSTARE